MGNVNKFKLITLSIGILFTSFFVLYVSSLFRHAKYQNTINSDSNFNILINPEEEYTFGIKVKYIPNNNFEKDITKSLLFNKMVVYLYKETEDMHPGKFFVRENSDKPFYAFGYSLKNRLITVHLALSKHYFNNPSETTKLLHKLTISIANVYRMYYPEDINNTTIDINKLLEQLNVYTQKELDKSVRYKIIRFY